MAEYGSGLEISSGWDGGFGWNLRVVDVLGKLLGSLDRCHHFGAGQILTTTDALAFPTCRSLQKGSQGVKWIGGNLMP